jgi:hypothetical protein
VKNVEVLWCSNPRAGAPNRWSFPPKVEKLLRTLTVDKQVLHLFGGQAKWGRRIDIDPTTRPHVIADAWLPPFKADAFDVVIIDPPYDRLEAEVKAQLCDAAGYIAREHVIWFHTVWVSAGPFMTLDRSWMVRVGDNHHVRCLQVFRLQAGKKPTPRRYFDRGPATKYNRWLAGEVGLPYGEAPEEPR